MIDCAQLLPVAPPAIGIFQRRSIDTLNMKKRFAVSTWAIMLAILMMLAACGPAVSSEQSEQMTREAGGETEVEAGGEAEAETGEVVEGPVVGIPPVEGETTETDSGLSITEVLAGEGRMPEVGDLVTMQDRKSVV